MKKEKDGKNTVFSNLFGNFPGIFIPMCYTFKSVCSQCTCTYVIILCGLQIRTVLTKAQKQACLESLHHGNLHDLLRFLSDLEQAVGRVGNVKGSALPAVEKLCQDVDGDSAFMCGVRTHLRANESIRVLEVLKLKKACSSLVTYLKASGRIDELSNTPKQCMDVHWNSTFTMLMSIYEIYAVSVWLARETGKRQAGRRPEGPWD